MSTKTISKRVALATVVALGAGVLSLVSVSSASATANNGLGTAGPTAANTVLNVATINSVTGQAVVAATGEADYSTGLLAMGDTVAGTTQTATLLSTGTITVYTAGIATTTSTASFVVTGGTIVNSYANASATTLLNSGATVFTQSNHATAVSIAVKPNAGVSTMTIALYNAAVAGNSASVANASPTSGTLNGQVVVSLATSSVSGVVSQTKSGVFYFAGGSSAASSDVTTLTPAPGTSNWKTSQYASVVVKDAYSVGIAANGFVAATATNGALVKLTAAASSSATSATATSDYYSTSSGAGANGVSITVTDPTNAPLTTTVTISYNGIVVGTKAFTFLGDVAKVTLSSAGNGSTGQSTAVKGNSYTIAFADSAGNAVYPDGSSAYTQYIAKNANAAGTGLSFTASNITQWPTSTVTGAGTYGCGSINVTGQLIVDYTNTAGVVITSNSLPISCSGAPVSYSAKLDKAKYAPGDIATLTVTFKDSSGALAADLAAAQTGAITDGTTTTSVNVPAIAGSQLTAVVAPSKSDSTTNGVATYKFIVGTTAGSYQAVVDFPRIDSVTQSAVTVSYSIADGSTSLNDVLKGIVSLIASINKQIAALAKLVTKK
jgi:hypothetical protein